MKKIMVLVSTLTLVLILSGCAVPNADVVNTTTPSATTETTSIQTNNAKVNIYVSSPEKALEQLTMWNPVNQPAAANGTLITELTVSSLQLTELTNTLSDLATDGVIYGEKTLYEATELTENTSEINILVEVSLIPVELLESL